jgi:hypothetical protein
MSRLESGVCGLHSAKRFAGRIEDGYLTITVFTLPRHLSDLATSSQLNLHLAEAKDLLSLGLEAGIVEPLISWPSYPSENRL